MTVVFVHSLICLRDYGCTTIKTLFNFWYLDPVDQRTAVSTGTTMRFYLACKTIFFYCFCWCFPPDWPTQPGFVPHRVRPGANVGPEAAAELKAGKLTIAASPMLATKRRSALRSSSVGGTAVQSSEEAEVEEAASKQFRARPMPDYSKLASQVCVLTFRAFANVMACDPVGNSPIPAVGSLILCWSNGLALYYIGVIVWVAQHQASLFAAACSSTGVMGILHV